MPPPPSLDGAAQRTVACASAACADTACGAPGRCTTTVNHGLSRPRAEANDAPVVVIEPAEPVRVRLVMRPPHCSPVVRPFWSVPESCSRELTASLANRPIEWYADSTWPAVTLSVQV